jgi:hypothetical protein
MTSRKRTSKKKPTESTTIVAEPPASAEPAAAVTEPPVAQLPEAEPKAIEPRSDDQSFADRVGQRKWIPAPDPFGIATDKLAGIGLFESKHDRQMAIKFGEGRPEDKPSQAVIDMLKEAEYRWNPVDRIWTHPVRPDSAMSTRIEAEWLYQELRQIIRQEKGIEAGKEVPF